ncbi:MAG TPA: polysaccharide lyase family 8 super-sandwich domain-containing protein [Opitutaceae bacterium]|nr:polysaccharide lyase family 8 super-sandwich domain-containing protein [Opitutaceae bacterium]
MHPAILWQRLLGVSLLFCFGAALQAGPRPAHVSPAMQKVVDQFCAFNRHKGIEEQHPDPTQALAYARSLKADGSWPDLDYASAARSAWPPRDHCRRMVAMAMVAAGGMDVSGDDRKRLLDSIHRAFRFWIRHDFQCPNWYDNEISIPKLIGTCALLLGENLAPDEYAYATQISLARYGIGKAGQNKVWLAENTLIRGLLQGDEALVNQAAPTIWNELHVSMEEGVQPDYSFHQHGPQQQFGLYGLAFAAEIGRWGTVLQGTPWALPEDKLEVFRHYLLDGENWVSWRGAMDISSCGRHLMPRNPLDGAAETAAVMEEAAVFDPGSAPAYQAFAARNQPGVPNDLVGNKYFWRSDYMVHRTGEFAATLKLSSKRVVGTEMVNAQNLSGYYLADGALYLYQSGGEYTDIFPVWDWRKIPGVTCAQTELPAFKTTLVQTDVPGLEFKTSSVPSDFVGGVSDGTNGCAALDYARDGVVAKKAWFFGANFVVCLGAGISGEARAPIVTTINQCLLRGSIRLQQNGKVKSLQAAGGTSLAKVEWVEHDGWRYVFPGGTPAHLKAGRVTGNWKKVFANPDTPKGDVTENVFTLWLDHGKAPQDASYACVIMPAGEKTTAAVVANTPEVQAVKIDQALFGAVFWQPGKVELADGLLAWVDQPCIVLVDTDMRAAWISDPTQKLASIRLQVGELVQTVTLPTGGEAGRSVAVNIRP